MAVAGGKVADNSEIELEVLSSRNDSIDVDQGFILDAMAILPRGSKNTAI